MVIGEIIKELRIAKGLTQAALAKALGYGHAIIGFWESGKHEPTVGALAALATFFNVSADFFFGFDKRKFMDITDLSEEQVAVLSMIIDQFKHK